MNSNYRASGKGAPIKVASCSYPTSTEYYLAKDRFTYIGSYDYQLSGQPDLFVARTRWNCDEHVEGRVLHVVSRLGVPLLYVKEAGALAEHAR